MTVSYSLRDGMIPLSKSILLFEGLANSFMLIGVSGMDLPQPKIVDSPLH